MESSQKPVFLKETKLIWSVFLFCIFRYCRRVWVCVKAGKNFHYSCLNSFVKRSCEFLKRRVKSRRHVRGFILPVFHWHRPCMQNIHAIKIAFVPMPCRWIKFSV